MITRQQTIDAMGRPADTITQVMFLVEYIKHRKDEIWRPKAVDTRQINEAYSYAINWCARLYTINILRDKTGQVIKIY